MPRIVYKPKAFGASSLELIEQCNEIIEEYQEDGYVLTLRQLFYQLVSRDLIANTTQDYKRLGGIVSDARLAGQIDWDAIEDRTRNLTTIPSWENPGDIIESAADSYQIDFWDPEFQLYRPEVWIEKEALAGVFERICNKMRVPFIACRGYMSQSEMWAAGQRFQAHIENGQIPFILHFGDHDCSGIDMTRDIVDRLRLFVKDEFVCKHLDRRAGMHECIERKALNIDQVRKYNPPPNPAKLTDSRSTSYVKKFGNESWELDALEPKVLAALVKDSLTSIIDVGAWNETKQREKEEKELLKKAATNWNAIKKTL